MELITSENQKIKISDLPAKVILIIFSSFDKDDLPSLVYIDHMQNQLKHFGLQVIYIKTESSGIMIGNFKPLVYDDNGYISRILDARAGQSIIIDRNLTIKAKFDKFSPLILYKKISNLLFTDNLASHENTRQKTIDLLKSLHFNNIENGEGEIVSDSIRKVPTIILISISQCFTCREHNRILLLKEIARLGKSKINVLLLFGKGNDFYSIKAFARRAELFKYMKIGLIQMTEGTDQESYYKLFDFMVDPRIIIYNENGEPIFVENEENQHLITVNYIRRLLGV